jgi:putative membrane protein
MGMSVPPPYEIIINIIELVPVFMQLDKRDKFCIVLLALFIIVLIISVINPKDYMDWALEVMIPVGAVIILIATYKRFPMTPMVYVLVLLHSFIILYGGHYTYAEAPLGDWMKPIFGFHRNNYDRIGHLAFGFFPAVIIREVIIRTTTLKRGKMLAFLVVCVIGAAAAFYELIEMGTALIVNPDLGAAYLGSQGDIWDSQWDMTAAFCGVILGLLVFTSLHTKQMKKYGYYSDAPKGGTEGEFGPRDEVPAQDGTRRDRMSEKRKKGIKRQ